MTHSERLMIGVAGPTCSGKTTLERNLVATLQDTISVLPFDDMTKELEDPSDIGLDSWEDPGCYRWEDYRRHLIELKQGQSTNIQLNHWETRVTGQHERLIEPRPVIVSVGFLALYDRVAREQFDIKLYLDLPENEIARRRSEVERLLHPHHDPLPYITKHILPATQRFVLPQREIADVVIDGRRSPEHIHDEVLKIISQHYPNHELINR